MAIRWDPQQVLDALQLVEASLDDAYPFLEQANKDARAAAQQIPNLPDYMSQPLNFMVENLASAVARCRRQVQGVRERIPNTWAPPAVEKPKLL